MMSGLKKVFFLEGLFASVVVLGYTASHGNVITDELRVDIEMLVGRMKEQLKHLKHVTRDQFDVLATTVVEEYATQVDHTNDAKKMLSILLKSKWYEIDEERLVKKEQKLMLHE